MKKPIHVLFVSHDSSLYGAQLSLLGLLERLDRAHFEPLVVANNEGPLIDAIRKLNISVIQSPIVHWITAGEKTNLTLMQDVKAWARRTKRLITGLRGRVKAFSHLIEENNIDIVYTNTVICLEGALAAKLTKRPHIWHLREQVKGNSQLNPIIPVSLIPWIIHFLSIRVLVNSKHLYRGFNYYPLQKKLAIVYNGVDPDRFAIDQVVASNALRSELNIPQNSKVVVIIGAIIPRKGLLLLAQAAVRLVSSIPDIAFLVVGEGCAEYVQFVQNQIKEDGLEKSFHFLGWRADIPHILASANALVIAADEEPFGRTAIEAMAAGVPIVSTKCGGPEEIIIDKVTGLLVSRNNVPEMADAIEVILTNPKLSENLVKAGKDRLNQMFTLQAYAKNVQSEFESAINSFYLMDAAT